MKRKHKLYSNPKKPFDKVRIDEEKNIMKEFGLKNKKEIWKAEAKIKLVREKVRKLIKSPHEKQKVLFDQLREIGIKADANGILVNDLYSHDHPQTNVEIKGRKNNFTNFNVEVMSGATGFDIQDAKIRIRG